MTLYGILSEKKKIDRHFQTKKLQALSGRFYYRKKVDRRTFLDMKIFQAGNVNLHIRHLLFAVTVNFGSV